ncbi:hypothetical protein CSC42_2274 [Pseudomonas aeruginosa]|nr:hypothetical protein CSC42_2274 [Pseudomonas aeruginosa]
MATRHARAVALPGEVARGRGRWRSPGANRGFAGASRKSSPAPPRTAARSRSASPPRWRWPSCRGPCSRPRPAGRGRRTAPACAAARRRPAPPRCG